MKKSNEAVSKDIYIVGPENSKFKGWNGASDSKEETITLDVNKATEITAEFE